MIKIGKALLFILCLNIASWMVVEGGFSRSGVRPLSVTEKAEEVNKTIPKDLKADPGGIFVGFVQMGFFLLWNGLGWLMFGFPKLLSAYKVPFIIYGPLVLIWTVIMMMFFIEFISGRDITGG